MYGLHVAVQTNVEAGEMPDGRKMSNKQRQQQQQLYIVYEQKPGMNTTKAENSDTFLLWQGDAVVDVANNKM